MSTSETNIEKTLNSHPMPETNIEKTFNFHPERGTHSIYKFSAGAKMDSEKELKGDKLLLKGLLFHGFHGVKPEETKLGQKFLIDIDAWMDLRAAGISDNLFDSVSYTDIYDIAKDIVEGPPHKLLESVAHVIATTTLIKFPNISAVRVKVVKPHVSISGPLDYLGVEIIRYQSIEGL